MMYSKDGLFQLIRNALSDGVAYANLEALSASDWCNVIDLSFAQGVASISIDGLQKIVAVYTGRELLLNSPEFEDLKYEWIGSVFQMECNFAKYLSAAKALGKIYADKGLNTLVLKGLVFSECYPIPSHRSSCDLDCYLFDGFEKGNQLVEQLGVMVNRNYFKNSSFDFNGLHVENHHYFTAFRGNRKAKEYERLLHQELASGEKRPIFDSDLLAPPVMFTALFCISHAQTHFLTEGITLRHILDWALFRKRHYDEIDWTRFESVCRKYGMWQFAQTFTRIGLFLLGEAEYTSLLPIDLRLLDDTLYSPREKKQSGMRRRVQLILKSLRSGWKYRHFSDQAVLQHMLQRVVGFFEGSSIN